MEESLFEKELKDLLGDDFYMGKLIRTGGNQDDEVFIIPPDCITSGREYFKCGSCGSIHDVELPAIGHRYKSYENTKLKWEMYDSEKGGFTLDTSKNKSNIIYKADFNKYTYAMSKWRITIPEGVTIPDYYIYAYPRTSQGTSYDPCTMTIQLDGSTNPSGYDTGRYDYYYGSTHRYGKYPVTTSVTREKFRNSYAK